MGLSIVSTVALMLVVASSTAIAFVNSAFTELERYLAQVIDPAFLGFIALVIGVFSVLGIEGTIVVVAMKEGLVKGEAELSRRKLVASYLLLSISMIAGFYQRIGLVQNAAAQIAAGWVLAFAGAISTPVALMYAAPLLGQLAEFQGAKEKQWLEEAKAEFERSQEYELSQRELKEALDESERRRQAAEEVADAEKRKTLAAIRRGHVVTAGPEGALHVIPTAAAAAVPYPSNGGSHVPSNGKPSTRQIINDYLLLKSLRLSDAIESAEVARWYEGKANLPHDPNLSTAIRTQLSRMRKEAGITLSEG